MLAHSLLTASLAAAVAGQSALDGGIAPSALVDLPSTDPLAFLNLLASMGKQGHWFALAVAALIGVIAGLKKLAQVLGPKVPGPVGDAISFVDSDRGGTVLALLTGTFGTVLVALLGGNPVSLPLFAAGIGAGLAAIGGFTGLKKIFAPADKVVVPASGTPPNPAKSL